MNPITIDQNDNTQVQAMRTCRIPRYTTAIIREKNEIVSADIRKVRSPRDIAGIVAPLIGDSDREVSGILMLDTKNNVRGIHIASVGDLSSAIVHPREIFKAAIVGNAASVIFFHNHPSGDTTPSPEDILVSKRLYQAGEILGIELLDSVIIGETRHYSLREHGQV